MTKQTVVAAILVDDLAFPTRVLAAHRRHHTPGWEFPGGKCEAGEEPLAALRRELSEELGLEQVSIGAELTSQIGAWPINERLEMRLWWAQSWDEPAVGSDHDDLRWCSVDDLLSGSWLPADVAPMMAVRNRLVMQHKPRYTAVTPLAGGILRPLVLTDLDDMTRLWSDLELTRNLGHLALNPAQAELYVRGRLLEVERGDLIQLVVEWAGEVIAEARITLSPAWSVHGATGEWTASIGDSVRSDWQGQGIGTALIGEVLRICFEELGVRLVRATVFDRAQASGRVLRKFGMRALGRHPQCFRDVDGTWRDDDLYTLTRQEWDSRQISVGDAVDQGRLPGGVDRPDQMHNSPTEC